MSQSSFRSLPSGCLTTPNGTAVFHESLYSAIPPAQRREALVNAHLFSLGATQSDTTGAGKWMESCKSCPPRLWGSSDPLRYTRRYRQTTEGRGRESLIQPWEQHDAGIGTLEVRLRAQVLPGIPMRRNHVLFSLCGGHNSYTCIAGGTLHPDCIPHGQRREDAVAEMPFVFASNYCDSWNPHPLPNIYVGCVVAFQGSRAYLLVQEPQPPGGQSKTPFVDVLMRLDAFDVAGVLKIKCKELLRSPTLQSSDSSRPLDSVERFMTLDRKNHEDRIHLTQITQDGGVVVNVWTESSDEWRECGRITTNNSKLSSNDPFCHNVAGIPVYDSTQTCLKKIRVFAECLGDDELCFIPDGSMTEAGGFQTRLGNVVRATASGSDPFFEVVPSCLTKFEGVESLVPSSPEGGGAYASMHAPRDLTADLDYQDAIYDTPSDQEVPFTSPSVSWSDTNMLSPEKSAVNWGNLSRKAPTLPHAKSMSMGASSRSDSQLVPRDYLYQLIDEVRNKAIEPYESLRRLRDSLISAAQDAIGPASETGAPLHICAGMSAGQFQRRVVSPMQQFVQLSTRGAMITFMERLESEGDCLVEDVSSSVQPTPTTTARPNNSGKLPSQLHGVNANLIQPSSLCHRLAVNIRPKNLSSNNPAPFVQLMLGSAKDGAAQKRGLLAAACPAASNANSLKSVAAQWIASGPAKSSD